MRDRLLRLLHGHAGRVVLLASAAACALLVLSAAFALTSSSSSSSVTVCIGKKHTIDFNELYVAKKAGFCGPGVKKLKWKKPNTHGFFVFCQGDPNDGSEFHSELYGRKKGNNTAKINRARELATRCVGAKGDHERGRH